MVLSSWNLAVSVTVLIFKLFIKVIKYITVFVCNVWNMHWIWCIGFSWYSLREFWCNISWISINVTRKLKQGIGLKVCWKRVVECLVTDGTCINPLKPELNPICYLLALLGAHHFLHVSRIRVKLLTFKRLMSHIYGAPILDVSRSHTTTQHSR